MSCDEFRDRLTAGAEASPEVSEHLQRCAGCARFASRIGIARELLREHHGNFEPDAHFAGRVAARLQDRSASVLGWAAVRVLPVTLALLLVLAWMSWQVTPESASSYASSPTEDPLSWVLDPTGTGS